MLRLAGEQVESLFDELLPVEVRELPEDLAVLDRLLADPRLLAPIRRAWAQTARNHGRPTIPMASFVRLIIIKQRTGWGYQTLVREVSDSLHLRRFCLLPLTAQVPDESTVRKLVRRLGPKTVEELTRAVPLPSPSRRAAPTATGSIGPVTAEPTTHSEAPRDQPGTRPPSLPHVHLEAAVKARRRPRSWQERMRLSARAASLTRCAALPVRPMPLWPGASAIGWRSCRDLYARQHS